MLFLEIVFDDHAENSKLMKEVTIDMLTTIA